MVQRCTNFFEVEMDKGTRVWWGYDLEHRSR